MNTLTKALHLLGENAEAIRELTRKIEGLQAAYDLMSASAGAERDAAREFIARLDLPPPSEWPQFGIVAEQKPAQSTGAALIAEERARQMSKEGWTPEHDDEHASGELAWASVCYAAPAEVRSLAKVPLSSVCGCREAMCPHVGPGTREVWRDPWPWGVEWDKRDNHPRMKRLVIAGALIAAEIDRHLRAGGQPWTGSSGQIDPAQQHAYALAKVTQERDAARAALTKMTADRDHESQAADAYKEERNAYREERDLARHGRDEAQAALDEASKVLSAVCVASTLIPGEFLIDPPKHAAVSAILSVIRDRDIARTEADSALCEAERLEQERDALQEVRLGEHGALKEIAAFVGVDCMAPNFASMTAHCAQTLIADLRATLADKAHVLQEYAKLRDEVARLREQTTSRTYKAGDHQPEYVMWWSNRDQEWDRLCGDPLDPEDIWLPMPPPPDQPWTGSTGPLDPAQQWGADALQRVTQERDALREAHREAQEALRDQEAATGNALQQRDDLARALHDAAVCLGKKHGALELDRDAAIASRDAARTAAEDVIYEKYKMYARMTQEQEALRERIDLLTLERDDAKTKLARLDHYVDGLAFDTGVVALGLAAGFDAYRRLTQATDILRKWGWDKEQIASFFALPGEPRTHVFPVVSPGGIRGIVSVILERDEARAAIVSVTQERDAARCALQSTTEEKDRLLVQIAQAQDVTAVLRLECDEARAERDKAMGALDHAVRDLESVQEELRATLTHRDEAIALLTDERDTARRAHAWAINEHAQDAQTFGGRLTEAIRDRDEARAAIASVTQERDAAQVEASRLHSAARDAWFVAASRTDERNALRLERDEASKVAAQAQDAAELRRAERDEAQKEAARLRDELAVERRRYAFAAEHWGAADIDALRAERDEALAEVARLRDEVTRLHKAARDAWFAAACGNDERKEVERLLDERNCARMERDEANKVAASLRDDVAKLRGLLTPKRGNPPVRQYCLYWAQRPGEVGDDRTPRWADAHGSSLAPEDWWLPQPPPPQPPPPPPPDEAGQERKTPPPPTGGGDQQTQITWAALLGVVRCDHGRGAGACLVMGCLHHRAMGGDARKARVENSRGPLTEAERHEMGSLQVYVDHCSIGDRPQSPSAAKLRRLMDLEERAWQEAEEERKARAEVSRLADKMERPALPEARHVGVLS